MGELIINSKKHGIHTVYFDDEDYELVSKYKWFLCKSDKTFYARAHSHFENGKQKFAKMHRVIMNASPGTQVDHKNHNGLDNRKENLRVCTNRQNSQNREKSSSSVSKYKGLTKSRSGWAVYVHNGDHHLFVGRYHNEEVAAHQYDYYALKLHGEFANINFKDYDYDSYIPPSVADFKNNCSSIYSGVSFHIFHNKWSVKVTHDGVRRHLGYYETELEAARAYNQYIIDNNLDKKLNDLPD